MTLHLVTGGAGFIGSALVRRLVADGHRVRVLDDASRGRPGRLDDVRASIELVTGDVRRAHDVAAACDGVDAIWHLAAVNGTEFFYTKPELVLEVGVKGILNVLDGATRHGVRQLFVASSSEVYQTPARIPTDETVALSIPDPRNPRYSYAGGKIISELLALNQGRRGFDRVVVFRPHNVYGPDMGWEHVIPQLALRVRALARSVPEDPLHVPIQGTGRETRAFVHVDDAIEGLMRIFAGGEHLGIYHVGTDVETSIADLVREVGCFFGRGTEVVPGPPAEGGTPRRCPDISRLRALGYSPRISISEGLPRALRWYDEHADQREEGRS